MQARILWSLVIGAVALAPGAAPGADEPAAPGKVYGEWRIRVKPYQGTTYRNLIEREGLPLFRESGGRMVGWWNTLVGDLYEHVTIWEYDGMAGFGKQVAYLSKDPRFARFVAQRDPLLDGEVSRFMRPAAFAEQVELPDRSDVVVHEIHRVPVKNLGVYLALMEKDGLLLLKKHGFRPVGPFLTDVGHWDEVTYLFRFKSLAEREQLMAKFEKSDDAKKYGKINELVSDIRTRVLVPTPFGARQSGRAAPWPTAPSSLPHAEQVAAGVYAVGYADRYHSANSGWVVLADETLLIDLPRGIPTAEYLADVARTTGKPARTLALTRFEAGDAAAVADLLARGVQRVVTSPAVRSRLLAAPEKVPPSAVRAVPFRASVGDRTHTAFFLALDGIIDGAGGVVHVLGRRVLFGGPFVVHGPRARLPGSDTVAWIDALARLEKLDPAHVVPGFGSWGGADLVARQRRFLTEIRRQVAYGVAQGRPLELIQKETRIPAPFLVWMPYDTPVAEDIEHLYRELTVPAAPFHGHPPEAGDPRPHALVLIGDQPHEPGHIEAGLGPVFAATGVVPHFTLDVRALTAATLARVQLLVILRDGLQRPSADAKANYVWMTPEQEQAVVHFVERGGGFLNLHNAMGLYPPGGPYLHLVGGEYTGHGPLERFRVEVVDGSHPVTRGVGPFSVPDEQHAPRYDEARIHLLLRSRSDEGETAAAGWVREVGKGRVCHLAPGHTLEALLEPTYQHLMRNAVRWCLRHEVPPVVTRAGTGRREARP